MAQKRQQDSRLQIRCKADERDLMERAAEADERSLSQWVVRAAVKTARAQLGEKGGAGWFGGCVIVYGGYTLATFL